jgi:hypothetical protein
MSPDEHDDLWRLLGKARPTHVSPFFARNVLRALREQEAAPAVFSWRWLRQRWMYAGSALLAVIVAVAATRREPAPGIDPIDQAAREVASSPDFNVIANLDDLLASQDNDVWLASFEE